MALLQPQQRDVHTAQPHVLSRLSMIAVDDKWASLGNLINHSIAIERTSHPALVHDGLKHKSTGFARNLRPDPRHYKLCGSVIAVFASSTSGVNPRPLLGNLGATIHKLALDRHQLLRKRPGTSRTSRTALGPYVELALGCSR